jgi:hypothetical protein
MSSISVRLCYRFLTIKPVPRWCWAVPTGGSWCQVVLVGGSWCWVVPVGTGRYWLVRVGAGWWNPVRLEMWVTIHVVVCRTVTAWDLLSPSPKIVPDFWQCIWLIGQPRLVYVYCMLSGMASVLAMFIEFMVDTLLILAQRYCWSLWTVVSLGYVDQR